MENVSNVLVDIIAAFWRMSARNVRQETQQLGMVAPVKTAVTWVGVRLYMCNIFLLLEFIYFTYFFSVGTWVWGWEVDLSSIIYICFSLFTVVAVSLLFIGHQFNCNPLLSPLMFSKVRNGTNIVIHKTLSSDIFVCIFKTVKCKLSHNIFNDSVYVIRLLCMSVASLVFMCECFNALSVFSFILPRYRYFAFV